MSTALERAVASAHAADGHRSVTPPIHGDRDVYLSIEQLVDSGSEYSEDEDTTVGRVGESRASLLARLVHLGIPVEDVTIDAAIEDVDGDTRDPLDQAGAERALDDLEYLRRSGVDEHSAAFVGEMDRVLRSAAHLFDSGRFDDGTTNENRRKAGPAKLSTRADEDPLYDSAADDSDASWVAARRRRGWRAAAVSPTLSRSTTSPDVENQHKEGYSLTSLSIPNASIPGAVVREVRTPQAAIGDDDGHADVEPPNAVVLSCPGCFGIVSFDGVELPFGDGTHFSAMSVANARIDVETELLPAGSNQTVMSSMLRHVLRPPGGGDTDDGEASLRASSTVRHPSMPPAMLRPVLCNSCGTHAGVWVAPSGPYVLSQVIAED